MRLLAEKDLRHFICMIVLAGMISGYGVALAIYINRITEFAGLNEPYKAPSWAASLNIEKEKITIPKSNLILVIQR